MPHQYTNSPTSRANRDPVRGGVLSIALVAVAVRLAAMLTIPPTHGDAAASYVFRAVRLVEGHWDALWAAWHPPGLSLLLALLSGLTARLLPPWWAGELLALACAAALILVADRLLAPRVVHQPVRLACALLLACNESLVQWQSSPLSEPVFLLACLLAVLLFDRDTLGPGRALAAGALAGFGATIRFEGAAAAVGLLVYTAWRSRSLRMTLSFALGATVSSGWLFAQVDFLQQAFAYQRQRLMVTLAPEVAPQVAMLVRAGRNALTDWLPSVLLLPYWMLVGVGAFRLALGAAPGQGRRLNLLFIATVVPVLATVALSEPHKRTGAMLLAPAMIWTSVALDALVTGAQDLGRRRGLRAALAIAVFLSVVEIGRFVPQWRTLAARRSVVAEVASVLRSERSRPGPIWAFGDDPSIYGVLGWSEPYDSWNPAAAYGPVPGDRSAEEFVNVLRARGYRYLAFVLPPGDSDSVSQEWWDGPQPRRSLLAPLATTPASYGLRSLNAPAPLWLFEIEASPGAATRS